MPLELILCVCVLSSHLFWTSDLCTHQPGSHSRRKVTYGFSTFLLRCLPLFLSREGFSLLFPSGTVKSNYLYPRINRSPLVGYDFFFIAVFGSKNPSLCDCTEIQTDGPTSKRFRGYQLKHRGRPATVSEIYIYIYLYININNAMILIPRVCCVLLCEGAPPPRLRESQASFFPGDDSAPPPVRCLFVIVAITGSFPELRKTPIPHLLSSLERQCRG